MGSGGGGGRRGEGGGQRGRGTKQGEEGVQREQGVKLAVSECVRIGTVPRPKPGHHHQHGRSERKAVLH